MSKDSEQQSKKKKSNSAVWGQIGREAKGKQVGQASGLNRQIDSAGELTGADTADLQQTYGNSFLQRVVQMGSGDGADGDSGGVADDITPVSRDATGTPAGGASDVETRIDRSRGQGQALPDGLKGQMEGKFGTDFSGVTIHNDGESDQLNRELGAQAFTTGSDIYFQQGKYNPDSQSGQKLIAHELTHVVQQGGTARSGVQPKLDVSEPDDKFEKEAEQVSETIMSSTSGQPDAVGPSAGEGVTEGEAPAAESAEPISAMTGDAQEAADKAGLDTSQVDDTAAKANEKIEEGANPQDVAKAVKGHMTGGKGGISKPSEASGSLLDAPSGGQQGGEQKQNKNEQDPEKIAETKVASGVKRPEIAEDGDSEDLKYDADNIEEPDMVSALPNWSEIAYGTIQMKEASASVGQEMEARNVMSQQSPLPGAAAAASSTTGAAPPTSSESPKSTELDKGDLIRDALVGGVAEGVVKGVTTAMADALVEGITSKVPFGDGALAAINIAADGEGWANGVKKTFSADAAKSAFGGWGKIDEETTDEGRAAFVIEKILGMVGYVEAIVGFFNQILQLGVALLYAIWAVLNAVPALQGAAAAVMVVIKFLEMIIKFLSLLGAILAVFKPPLQLTAVGLRIADLAKSKSDPDILLKKQANLRKLTSDFTTGVAQRGASAGIKKAQTAHEKSQARKKIDDMGDSVEGQSGKSKEQLKAEYREKFKEDFDSGTDTRGKWEKRRDTYKKTVGIVLGGGIVDVYDSGVGLGKAGKDLMGTGRAFSNRNEIRNARDTENGGLHGGQDYEAKKQNKIDEQAAAELERKQKQDEIDAHDQEKRRIEDEKSRLNTENTEKTDKKRDAETKKADLEAEHQHQREPYDKDVEDANREYTKSIRGLAEAKRDEASSKQTLDDIKSEQRNLAKQIEEKRALAAKSDSRNPVDAEGDKSGVDRSELAPQARKHFAQVDEVKQLEKRAAELDQKRDEAEGAVIWAEITLEGEKAKKNKAAQDKEAADAAKQKFEEDSRKIEEYAAEIHKLESDLETNRAAKDQLDTDQQTLDGKQQEYDDAVAARDRIQDRLAEIGPEMRELDQKWNRYQEGEKYMPEKMSGANAVTVKGQMSNINKLYGSDWAVWKINDYSKVEATLSLPNEVKNAVTIQNADPSLPAIAGKTTLLDGSEAEVSILDNYGELKNEDGVSNLVEKTLEFKQTAENNGIPIFPMDVSVTGSGKVSVWRPEITASSRVESENYSDTTDRFGIRSKSGQMIQKFKYTISFTKVSEQVLPTKLDDQPGGLVQRKAADGEEDLDKKRHDGELQIFESLPEPPDEAIYAIDASAAAYNQMIGEEYALSYQQQEFEEQERDQLGQKLEADAMAQTVNMNEDALDKHEQDTIQAQEAQKEMEAGAKQAEEPASEGFDISQEIAELLQSMIMPTQKAVAVAGKEGGTGDQSGDAKQVDQFGGKQNEGAGGAVDMVSQSKMTSKRWQAESAALQGDIQSQKKLYKGFSADAEQEQLILENGDDELLDAKEMNTEQLDDTRDQMDEQLMNYEDGISESEDWASEHEEIRLAMYDQLAADLEVAEEQQAEPAEDEMELE